MTALNGRRLILMTVASGLALLVGALWNVWASSEVPDLLGDYAGSWERPPTENSWGNDHGSFGSVYLQVTRQEQRRFAGILLIEGVPFQLQGTLAAQGQVTAVGVGETWNVVFRGTVMVDEEGRVVLAGQLRFAAEERSSGDIAAIAIHE